MRWTLGTWCSRTAVPDGRPGCPRLVRTDSPPRSRSSRFATIANRSTRVVATMDEVIRRVSEKYMDTGSVDAGYHIELVDERSAGRGGEVSGRFIVFDESASCEYMVDYCNMISLHGKELNTVTDIKKVWV